MLNWILLAEEAAADPATNANAGNKNGWVMWVILGVVLVAMIVLTIIPQKKRQKQQQNMLNSLTVGTKLMTVGGIVGTIQQVNADDTLIVNVGTEANPTLIVIDKKAVGYVLQNAPQPAVVDEPAVEEAPQEEPQVENVDAENVENVENVDDFAIDESAFEVENKDDEAHEE